MGLQLLDTFARTHHSLVTLDAVRKAGLSKMTWYRALRDERLHLIHPGVARVGGAPITREMHIHAAVLAAGPGALGSHRSAAHLSGHERPDDDPIDVTLPFRTRRARLEGVAIHRPRDLIDLRPVYYQGIPCTPLLRWLCDLPVVDPAGTHAAVGWAITERKASINALYMAVRTHSRRGRPGVPLLRAEIETWLLDGRPVDSELELAMARLARRYRLPTLEFHRRILRYEVDFWVVGTPIVIECDGWEDHDKRKHRFEADRRRRAELTAIGCNVLNPTWRQITRQPQWVAGIVRTAVAEWRRVGLPNWVPPVTNS